MKDGMIEIEVCHNAASVFIVNSYYNLRMLGV